jgi:hypothetical protein
MEIAEAKTVDVIGLSKIFTIHNSVGEAMRSLGVSA